jgi:hypothetical protein
VVPVVPVRQPDRAAPAVPAPVDRAAEVVVVAAAAVAALAVAIPAALIR